MYKCTKETMEKSILSDDNKKILEVVGKGPNGELPEYQCMNFTSFIKSNCGKIDEYKEAEKKTHRNLRRKKHH